MSKKRALLLGGTGAMGVYLTPNLVENGFIVDVTSRSDHIPDSDGINYITGDALNMEFLSKIMTTTAYDVVVDFMLYSTDDFKDRHQFFLDNTKHYIYVSSYRVFSDDAVISETSPRLLDVSTDKDFLKTNDYSLEKARQEDILRSSKHKNWTIIRPSITYSKERFQLGTLEADTILWRTFHDKPVILPNDMLSKQTTMTWAGDVAKMITGIILNKKKSFSEDYNVVTSEHVSWAAVANIYSDIIGLKYVPVSTQQYIEALGGGYVEYQVMYDRMFNRILDNSKVLNATKLKQTDFKTLKKGLREELMYFVKHREIDLIDSEKQRRIDDLTDTIFVRLRKKFRIRSRLSLFMNKAVSLKQRLRIRTRLRQASMSIKSAMHRREFSKADGAIITLSGYYNYGNMVQRFATQRFLEKHGYQFVSYAKDQEVSGDEADRLEYTRDFVERNIWRKQFDKKDTFKTYIVGSDQVWRKWGYDDIFDELGYYFLDFTKDKKVKRIAYAASIGQDSLKHADYTDAFIPFAKEMVQKFDFIGMREASGVSIVKKEWGMDSQLVIDPTLLLKASDYNELIDAAPYEIKRISSMFTYFILTDEPKRALIAKIARDAGLKDEGIYLESNEKLRPVEEWLAGIRDAKLVVIDSFHGMVFSIINNTAFVVLESGTGGASRITTLLSQLGLEDRYIPSKDAKSFDINTLPPIDWKAVNVKLDILRDKSAQWLLEAVRSNKKA